MEEVILKVLAKTMTGERFEKVVTGEKEYKKRNKTVAELSKQMEQYDLIKEIRLTIDRLISANNECNAKYSELAYVQGIKDSVAILKEMDLIKT